MVTCPQGIWVCSGIDDRCLYICSLVSRVGHSYGKRTMQYIHRLLLSPGLRSASLDYELCAPIEYAAQCHNNHNMLNLLPYRAREKCVIFGIIHIFTPLCTYKYFIYKRGYQSRRPFHNIRFRPPVMDIIESSLTVCMRERGRWLQQI